MSTSKLQREVSRLLSIHLGQHTIRENYYPEWLSTDNDSRLELDFYVEELKVAIEVQGDQHYVYTPHFHQSYDDFKAQVERDKIKREICQRHDVNLIEIDTYDEALCTILKLAKKNYEIPMHPKAVEQAKISYINIRLGGPRTIHKHIKQIRKIVREAKGHPIVGKDKIKLDCHIRAIEQYKEAKSCQNK